jgi:hypothetical protein
MLASAATVALIAALPLSTATAETPVNVWVNVPAGTKCLRYVVQDPNSDQTGIESGEVAFVEVNSSTVQRGSNAARFKTSLAGGSQLSVASVHIDENTPKCGDKNGGFTEVQRAEVTVSDPVPADLNLTLG